MKSSRVLGTAAVACALLAGPIAADTFNWTGSGSTAWSDSTSWNHINNPADAGTDDGMIPGTNDTAQADNGFINLDMDTAWVDVLNLSNDADIITGGFTLVVDNTNSTGQTTIAGTGVAGNNTQIFVQATGSGFPGFDTDYLNVTSGGELDMDGGVAHIDNYMNVDAGSFITGRGTIMFNDVPDEDDKQLNMAGTIRVDNGTLWLKVPDGGTLDLDGAGAGDSLIDVNGFGANTLVVDGQLNDDFSGRILLGDDDKVEFVQTWRANTFASGSEISMDPEHSLGTCEIAGGSFTLTGSNGKLNAKDGGNLISSSSFTVTSGATVTVTGADTVLEVSGTCHLNSAGNVTVNDGELLLTGINNWNGISSFTGTGMVQLNNTLVVTDHTTISVAHFNWDGNAQGSPFTSINPGNTFTINSELAWEIGGTTNDHNGRIDINEDAKIVVNDPTGWKLASNGELNFNGGAGTATLDGSSQFSPFGPVKVNSGTALILCDFNAIGGTVTVADGATLAFKGNGAGISEPAVLSFVTGNTTLQIGGSAGESSSLQVRQNTPFDWDGPINAQNHQTNIGVNSTLYITADIADEYDGTINMDTDSELTVTSGPWTMAGDLNLTGGATVRGTEVIITGDVTDSGGSDVPSFECPVTFRPTANVSIPTGNSLYLRGETTFDGGFFGTTGTLVQYANATVISDTSINGDLYDWSASVDLHKLTIKSGARLIVGGAFAPEYNDQLVVDDNGFLVVSGDAVSSWTVGSIGELELQGQQVRSPTAQVGGNDTLINEGTVRGNGRFYSGLTNHGLLDVGLSAGAMDIHNGLTLAADGTVKMELGGLTPYTQFDAISSPNATTIDGTLDLHVVAPYTPVLGQQLQIIATNGYTGTFAQTNNVAYSSLLGLAVRYDFNPLSVFVRVSVRGDTNFDDDVDISDFNALASHFDPSGSNPHNVWAKGNFDGDSDIDISDFNVLASNFNPLGYDGVAGDTVAADADPGTIDLIVDIATGEVWVDGNNASISGFQILSGANSLVPGDLVPAVLATMIGAPTNSFYAEGAFLATLVNSQISLGTLYDVSIDGQDLAFEYTFLNDPNAVQGNVVYVPEPATLVLAGIGGLMVLRRRRAV